ncbi:CarD family transcriptional regulator [Rubrobacter marinus]|uniref:CarD family transcriptional regulator n=1 Tax=Rubrobacter marinus TaxID=2653852 RepID=UPI00389AFE21
MAAESTNNDANETSNGEVTRVTFAEGDRVVYPNHGAGCISGWKRRRSSARSGATTSCTCRIRSSP